ncbi:tyrosine-type recombinase/integrase [Sporolactobacillus shoreicorticis]|uniref:Tyrosine-type recombinase/integrase n=1 Tax=Sporolactobacillus shoreicorticis TaxID=1923877 RepID=A0ABW5RZA3_9BACL|nr:tyrosine-type recombinase/integrase [Sporolactobacillus shoreicorticis]MCO7126768.1 tyrosine-type recombinase/integrase [Sporolactobacillus shoreicorticis]
MRKLVENFLELLNTERGLSKNTIEAYRSDLMHYTNYLSVEKHCSSWQDVTEMIVLNYMYFLRDSGCAPSTIARKAAAIRGLHRYLLLNRKTIADPSYSLELPKTQQSPLPPLLTKNQVEQLLEAPDLRTKIGKRDRALLEVLYATGMRVSECIRLDTSHVNLDLEFIRCLGKKGNERIVPLDSQAIFALHIYIKALHSDEEKVDLNRPLFMNRMNRRLTRQGIWKILKHYAEIAGISVPISPETLRKSLTAHLLQNGAPLEFIDELMGRQHTSAAMQYPRPNRLPLKKVYAMYHPRVKL